jgi:hypothetical protein
VIQRTPQGPAQRLSALGRTFYLSPRAPRQASPHETRFALLVPLVQGVDVCPEVPVAFGLWGEMPVRLRPVMLTLRTGIGNAPGDTGLKGG